MLRGAVGICIAVFKSELPTDTVEEQRERRKEWESGERERESG